MLLLFVRLMLNVQCMLLLLLLLLLL